MATDNKDKRAFTAKDVSTDKVDEVCEALGYGPGAWDCEDPREIIAAAWNVQPPAKRKATKRDQSLPSRASTLQKAPETVPSLFPKFLRTAYPRNNVVLRMNGCRGTAAQYYKDAGGWNLQVTRLPDGGFIADSPENQNTHLAHLAGVTLVPATKEEHAADNRGYC